MTIYSFVEAFIGYRFFFVYGNAQLFKRDKEKMRNKYSKHVARLLMSIVSKKKLVDQDLLRR